MAPKYILNYFDAPGAGETIRLMFHAAGVEFTDNRISSAEWPNHKADNKRFPLAQMPTLQVDDDVICQSKAIYRYVANELGLHGSNNNEKAIIDQVIETMNETTQDIIPIFFGGHDEETKKAKMAEFFASDKLKRQLTFIQNLLKKNNDGLGFFIGDKASLPDFAIYGMSLFLGKENPKWTDEYPQLKALLERVKNIDNIKKYYESQK